MILYILWATAGAKRHLEAYGRVYDDSLSQKWGEKYESLWRVFGLEGSFLGGEREVCGLVWMNGFGGGWYYI